MSLTMGFLGAGSMGAPMAANLAASGYRAQLWNRTMEKAPRQPTFPLASPPLLS